MKKLYLLVDGTHADPAQCDLGADNELRHENGVPVALDANCQPQTVEDLMVDSKNVEAAAAGLEAERATKIANAEEPSDADLLLTTDDVHPEAPKPAKPKAKKAPAKNREIRTR